MLVMPHSRYLTQKIVFRDLFQHALHDQLRTLQGKGVGMPRCLVGLLGVSVDGIEASGVHDTQF